MRCCWEEHPVDRPSFTDLRYQLDLMIEASTPAQYMEVTVDDAKDYYLLGTGSDGEDPGNTGTTCPDDVFPTSRSSGELAQSVTLGLPAWNPGSESSGICSDHHGHSPSSRSLGPFTLGRARSEFTLPRLTTSRTGNAKDLLRVSTCSHDGLLTSSVSEGFGSDGSSVDLNSWV